MRCASVLVAAILMLAGPAQAADDLVIKASIVSNFAELMGGETVHFQGTVVLDGGVSEDAADILMSYDTAAGKATWPTTVTLRREGTQQVRGPVQMGEGAAFPDVFEGTYRFDLTVQVPEVIGRFESTLMFKATSIDGRADTRIASLELIFSVTEGPDTDGDGLSDAHEKALGTDPKTWDTDKDSLSDCQEVKHKNREECRDPYRTNFDGGFGTDPTKADTDADGIRDEIEVWSTTNPLVADTDGDGLLDGQEQPNALKTDPLDSDTDDDGLLDGDEVTRNTNPLKPDTDGDGLTDGEEVTGARNNAWGNNPTDPLSKDSDGDSLTDDKEILELGTDPNSKDSDGDGLSDDWELRDGASDPTTKDSDDDGLEDPYEIFEWKTNPWDPDSDKDGLLDGEEVHRYKTDPMKVDSDGDRLSDYDEVTIWHTDPTLLDSDDDRLNDGDEVEVHHTDPAYFDTDRDGLSDGEEGTLYGTDPTIADFDEDLLNDGDEVQAGTDPIRADTDEDGYPDGHEFFHGGDPLDPMITPPDLDNDFLTDALDPDADGDGVLDESLLSGGLPGLGASIRYRTSITAFEAGDKEVVFTFAEAAGASGYQLWRLDESWIPVANATTTTLVDPEGRDGAQYRISAFTTIGAKDAGRATDSADIPWFDELPGWRLIVTDVTFDGQDLVIRNGGDAADFVFKVNGKQKTWPVAAYGETRVPVASLASGAFSIDWVDGDTLRNIASGENPGDKDTPMPVAWFALALVVALIIRRRA